MRIYAKIHKLIDIKKEMGKKDRKQRQREANQGAATKGSQPRSGNKGKPTEEQREHSPTGWVCDNSVVALKPRALPSLTPSLPAPLGVGIVH